MNKQQFLAEVRSRINCLSKPDIDRSLDYCGEMIDDLMENGMSEEEAVAAMGTPEQTASDILSDSVGQPPSFASSDSFDPHASAPDPSSGQSTEPPPDRTIPPEEAPQYTVPPQTQKSGSSFPTWLVVVLLVLGFPLWGSLTLTVFALALTLFLLLWTALITLYAIDFALAVCAIALLAVGFVSPLIGGVFGAGLASALGTFGLALVCGGCAILLFLLCLLFGKGVVGLHKVCFRALKRLFVRKGA